MNIDKYKAAPCGAANQFYILSILVLSAIQLDHHIQDQ